MNPALLALAVLALAPNAPDPNAPDPAADRLLEVGRWLESGLAPEASEGFAFDAPAGAFVRIDLDARARTYAWKVIDPAGAVRGTLDTRHDAKDCPFSFVAAAAGRYRVVITFEKEQEPARYALRLSAVRPPEPADLAQLDAETLMRDGHRLLDAGGRPGYEAALARYREAAERWHALGEGTLEVQALKSEGWPLLRLDRYADLLPLYEQVSRLARELGDRQSEGEALGNLGVAHAQLGQLAEALAAQEQALAVARTLDDPNGVPMTLRSIAFTRSHLGDVRGDRAALEEALAIRRRQGNVLAEAEVLSDLAVPCGLLGDYGVALDALERSRAIFAERKVMGSESVVLANLAFLHQVLGEAERARKEADRAVRLARESKERFVLSLALGTQARVRLALGDPAPAEAAAQEAVAILTALGSRSQRARTLVLLARAELRLGQPARSAKHAAEGLAVARAIGARPTEIEALLDEAELALATGDLAAARARATEARDFAREGAQGALELDALALSARAADRAGALGDARAALEDAAALVESVRGQVVSPEQRAGYLASMEYVHEALVDVTLRLDAARPGEDLAARALEAQERARARTLVEAIGEARAGIREGADPALLERERDARAALRAVAAGANGPVEPLLDRYRQVEAELRERSPRYAALTRPVPLSASAIQALLGPDTVLLVYTLGKERSWMWIVTRAGLRARVLPPRARLELLARRAHDAAEARGDPAASGALASLARQILPADDPALAPGRAAVLAVVADGALHYVPFAALPLRGRALIQDHVLAVLPSASTLAALREQFEDRPTAGRAVLALGDPVFDRSDPRVVSLRAPLAALASRVLLRSAHEVGLDRFPRLFATRREAERVVALSGSDGRAALDFEASRDAVLGGDVSSYRIVHFATHALVNDVHPELSGLVLSLVDPAGHPQDGFLRAVDVYNLRLHADLVVLSACSTALGREVKGEGLLGLSRAFMYAGTPRVVASLWRVSDRATAELMELFYAALARKLPPAAALREAQAAMARDPRYSDPSAWAGFELQGDWR